MERLHLVFKFLYLPTLHLVVLALILWWALILTYTPFADGVDRNTYILNSTALACLLILAYALARLRLGYGHPLNILVALFVALAGSSFHWLRLAAATDVSSPRLELATTFDGSVLPNGWTVDAGPNGHVIVRDGRLHVDTKAGSIAHAQTKLPLPEPPRKRPWRPAGLANRPRVQVIEWSSRARMTGRYFVIADFEHLLLQIIPSGAHITYWPLVGEPYGTEIRHAVAQDQLWHRWRVVRDEKRVAVYLDYQLIWSAMAGRPFRLFHLGESRTDELHGGRLDVDWFRYRVHLASEHIARAEPVTITPRLTD